MVARLPLLLAGPIVRRIESTRAYIWLATSEPVEVSLSVFTLSDVRQAKKDRASPAPVGAGKAASIELGAHLHITLVAATPLTQQSNSPQTNPQFRRGVLLSYDLAITQLKPNAQPQTLQDLGILDGPDSVAYRDGDPDRDIPLPTFYLQDPGRPSAFLHGSCRKPHGLGPDALASADVILGAKRTPEENRPSALFLTGDQIYADDVAPYLGVRVFELSWQLLGWTESIPGIGIPPLHRRSRQARALAKFTTEEAGDHLFMFGEFAAMYLLSWNAHLWRPPAREQSKDASWLAVEDTYIALRAVRRVLANVATYMILDDHEITDDWNISGRWKRKVQVSPAGRRIVANGLAAYWLFQGWGNNPQQFEDGHTAQVLQDYFRWRHDETAGTKYERTLWNMHWSYVAPTEPPVVIIDTRTERCYEPYPRTGKCRAEAYDEDDGPARLLSLGAHSVLREMIREVIKHCSTQEGGGSKPLLLVAATPVLDLPNVQEAKLAAQRHWPGSSYKFDPEAWVHNPAGFQDLLLTLLDEVAPRTCVVFSGDVHYGFACTGSVTQRSTGHSLSMVQFTSSPLKNAPNLPERIGLAKVVKYEPVQNSVWSSRPPKPIHLRVADFATFLEDLERQRAFLETWFRGTPPWIVPQDRVAASLCEDNPDWTVSTTINRLRTPDGKLQDWLEVTNLGYVVISPDRAEHDFYCPQKIANDAQSARVPTAEEYRRLLEALAIHSVTCQLASSPDSTPRPAKRR